MPLVLIKSLAPGAIFVFGGFCKVSEKSLPLVEAIKSYTNKKPIRFHTPGHKGKNPFLDEGKKFMENLFSWDLTEIAGLDDLFEPKGAIKLAEELLADLYKARKSFFLVNGATSGILGMMTSILKPKDKVIIPRNCHTSIISGLIITGAIPVYITPEKCKTLGVYTQITSEKVEEVLEKNPDVKAIIITNPVYQGFCPDLEKIITISKKRGLYVLVDEAHGPHFALNSKLPDSAGDFDADIWVQSPHKMLSSFTQSAWLHVKGDISDDIIRKSIGLNTSTSPSYLLMASLDMTRALMEEKGRDLWDESIMLSDFAKREINEKTCFYCVDNTIIKKYGIHDLDPCRLMINVSLAGYTGFQVDEILRDKFSIYAEYADFCNIYFLITFCNSKEDVIKLIKALSFFKEKEPINMIPVPEISEEPKITPRDAFFAKQNLMPLKKSCGMISKDAIFLYPPGIPIIMPGEIIQDGHIKAVESLISSGGKCRGLKDGYISVVIK